MKTAIIFTVLLVLLSAKTLSHLNTAYQTCCPDTYVLEPK